MPPSLTRGLLHPFTNSSALVDAPVSRHGSLMLLFIDPLENELGRSEGQPSADPQRSTPAEEGPSTTPAAGEEEVTGR